MTSKRKVTKYRTTLNQKFINTTLLNEPNSPHERESLFEFEQTRLPF
jgi:hypothetical protein